LPLSRIEVCAEGEVVRQPDKTLKFTAIRLSPRLSLIGATETQQSSARDMAHKADLYCVISRALRGNVEVTVIPEIINEQG
jgi:organic hydroperoxide reductase OsmC/OhrA